MFADGLRKHFPLKKGLLDRGPPPVVRAVDDVSFPNDEAATKLIYLALQNVGVHWKPAIEWRAAYAQFAIPFPDRIPAIMR
ncbi:MAG: hypothetical protein IT561_02445 [Alphaproteobacteria bacterium]|nr:hypothetical protein [Alphaproteobacteria bacterium]